MPLSQAPALLTRPFRHRCAIASTLMWVLASTAIADQTSAAAPEPAEPERWFQVELLVFSQPKSPLTDAPLTEEYWNEQLQPNFDSDAILLLPTSAPEQLLKQQQASDDQQQPPGSEGTQDSALNEELFNEQLETIEPTTSAATGSITVPEHATLAALSARQMPELYSQLYPQSVLVSAADSNVGVTDNAKTSVDVGGQSQADAVPPLEWPQSLPEVYQQGAFALLSEEQLNPSPGDTESDQPGNTKQELEPELEPIDLERLQKKGHRILFHGHWRQPVVDRQLSRSIIIRGGNMLDQQHFELEGELTLSLNRFLHLWPNLYLTQQLPQEWQPRDPATIAALAAAQLARQEAQALSQAQFNSDDFISAQPTASSGMASQSHSSTINDDSINFAIDSAAIAAEPLYTSSVFVTEPAVSGSEEALSQPSIEPTPRYLTVKLDQPRRMRSGELHYLDHPLFGLLIRITPYSLPVIEPELPLDNPAGSDAVSSAASSRATSAAIQSKSASAVAATATPSEPQ